MGKSGLGLVGSLLFSPGSWCMQGSVCALQESVSPVLCKFWWLCGGVICNLLQEGLCHTQVCCTQSPCPCSRPLLICTSSGDAQTQFYLSLCGVPGSWYAQSMFEPDILDCEVKWALGSITMKKTSGGDGIPVELFQILKDDAVKVLHSLCQQIWKTQQ